MKFNQLSFNGQLEYDVNLCVYAGLSYLPYVFHVFVIFFFTMCYLS